jgi:GH25 family lysozyme M1 (1,4-beta-N-acetylmuramidase)
MGFYAQLYTYTGYKYELDMARLSSRWDVWLADYTGKTPKVDFNYNAHQHTSKGAVPGVKLRKKARRVTSGEKRSKL